MFHIEKSDEGWTINIGMLKGTEREIESKLREISSTFRNATLEKRYLEKGTITLTTWLEYGDWRDEEYDLQFTVPTPWLIDTLKKEDKTLVLTLSPEYQKRDLYLKAKKESVLLGEKEVVSEDK